MNVPAKRDHGQLSSVQSSVDERASTALQRAINITDADFYSVGGGKREPSARVWAVLSNQKGISTRVVAYGQNGQQAFAVVRGWVGREDSPSVQHEEAMVIDFPAEQQTLIFDMLDKARRDSRPMPPFVLSETGEVILTSLDDQMHLVRQMNRIKRFGVRIAVTKAQTRLTKKLLNAEHREPEELRFEQAEVTESADPGYDRQMQAQPPTAPPPLPGSRPGPSAQLRGIMGGEG